MNDQGTSAGSRSQRGSVLGSVAAALIDAHGLVVWWSRAAQRLLGWTGEEVAGRPARAFLGEEEPCPGPSGAVLRRRLRHRSGRVVEADVRICGADGPAERLVLMLTPGERDGWDRNLDIARALLAQDGIGVAQYDMAGQLVRTNTAMELLRPEGAGGDWLGRLTARDGGGTARTGFEQVAATGRPLSARVYDLAPGGGAAALSVSCFRINDPCGVPVGTMVEASRVTDKDFRLDLTYRQAFEIGQSLDVVEVARDLTRVLVPALGDLAAVDYPDDVLEGRDPPHGYPGQEASAPRRVAVRTAEGPWPARLIQVGETIPRVAETPEIAALVVGDVLVADAEQARRILGGDPERIARFMPEGMHSSLGCPLYRSGRFFGYAMVYRTRTAAPFGEADAKLMHDLCARTATAIDNAFRFAREHQRAVVLQRSLLPPAATHSTAAETAGVYLPAGGSVSVGGDWYDAFDLPSLRIGLVVGDVVGHGLEAAATMARLRTAVQTLAALDLPPDELLGRLDDLVRRMQTEADQPDTVGGSCLFAVYDPVTRTCRMASAGHPPPALVTPGGEVDFVPLAPGPVLGVGDHLFEVTTVTLAPGSTLVCYTDGLLGRDVATGMDRLKSDLTALCRAGGSPAALGDALVARGPDADNPADDITVLLTRTRALPEDSTAVWEYPADLSAVSDARAHVQERLTRWGLEELLFSTELIVSELVTNAMRYAGGPVTLRLVRDRVLVCEVSDPSSTQPRLRRALDTDEGGRGLFLVAQLTTRWGSRHAADGKTIWTEQELP
ncbi:SpoIIE family protein phosphatase [Streptomyces bambusae]|uniref:ATP-binding SpoIIE family protein phosphatase n=1 Tax=Streptomyces bambusae TaxID=1550616 RepID=UPI001CFC5E9A|nr:SpoIIE family protein phosphatase [Streptomyces bambusae]MCB5167334.1 SpoIIE family protein phosphatase [Streptomyces bambusae]